VVSVSEMSLDILIGPMFAGKSSRILSIVSRYSALGTPVLVVKPSKDTRYGNVSAIVTHDANTCPCICVQDLDDIPLEDILKYQVIIVEEAQFFKHLIPFVEHVVDTHGRNLYLVGLDGDSNRRKFGEILDCIPLADRVERITAFCQKCANGTPGLFSHRKHGISDQQVLIGGHNAYMTLCRQCYMREGAYM
jgi:thymidine kinase